MWEALDMTVLAQNVAVNGESFIALASRTVRTASATSHAIASVSGATASPRERVAP